MLIGTDPGIFRPPPTRADGGIGRAREISAGAVSAAPAPPKEPQTSHSSNSSAAPPGLPRAAALRDGANIRDACFVAADLALPAMTYGLLCKFALP
jgi:hypothetical protein